LGAAAMAAAAMAAAAMVAVETVAATMAAGAMAAGAMAAMVAVETVAAAMAAAARTVAWAGSCRGHCMWSRRRLYRHLFLSTCIACIYHCHYRYSNDRNTWCTWSHLYSSRNSYH
jgi:hypothetical protein